MAFLSRFYHWWHFIWGWVGPGCEYARRALALYHIVNLGLAGGPGLDTTAIYNKLIPIQPSIPKSLIINAIDLSCLGAIQPDKLTGQTTTLASVRSYS